MAILFANDASSTLQAGITTSATQIVIATADASLFPAPGSGDYFLATVANQAGVVEIMKCTARSGNVLSVARGQEGTTAFAFAAGAIVDLHLTKGTMEALTQVTGENLPAHNHTAAQISNLSAAVVPFTPAGNLTSTAVQAAIAELDAKKVGTDGSGATGFWNITVTYLAASQQTNAILGAQKSLSMAQNDYDNKGSFVCRSSGTGDANLAGLTFWNDNFATKLGIRADGYFGLGGWSHAPWRWYVDPSGNMTAAGNVTAYSDERDKMGWRGFAPDFLEKLSKVKTGKYTRKSTGERQVGVSAQSLRKVMPEAVVVGQDGDKLSVAYGNAALAAAVVLAREVVALRAEIAALKAGSTA